MIFNKDDLIIIDQNTWEKSQRRLKDLNGS